MEPLIESSWLSLLPPSSSVLDLRSNDDINGNDMGVREQTPIGQEDSALRCLLHTPDSVSFPCPALENSATYSNVAITNGFEEFHPIPVNNPAATAQSSCMLLEDFPFPSRLEPQNQRHFLLPESDHCGSPLVAEPRRGSAPVAGHDLICPPERPLVPPSGQKPASSDSCGSRQASGDSAAAGVVGANWRHNRTARPKQPKKLTRKRPAGQDNGTGVNGEMMDDAPSQRKMPKRKESDTTTTTTRDWCFACPFYKRDGIKYEACLPYLLSRIKDVKQHIYRQHSWPSYHCSRCWETFEKDASLNHHVEAKCCQPRHCPWNGADLISGDKQTQLGQRLDRKDSLEQQWYQIWDILFPGASRPVSIYRGNNIDEAISIVQLLWERRGVKTLESVVEETISTAKLEATGISSVSGLVGVMVDTMTAVLDRFQAERWVPAGRDGSCCSPSLRRNCNRESCPSQISTDVFGTVDFDMEGGLDWING